MVVWPTFLSAGPPPTIAAKPLTPTSPIAMPTGTRSSISTNRTTNPTTARRSLSMPLLDGPRGGGSLRRLVHRLRPEDQAIGPHHDQHHGGDVAEPGDEHERPGRDAQVEGDEMVDVGDPHLVGEHDRLHRHDEQQHERREHVDGALEA